MKILHVISTLDVGGAEMHVLSQVRGQVARGHEVRVAYLLGEGALVADYEAAGAHCIGCVGKGPLALWKLRPHLRWGELVHSHLLRADFVTALAVCLFGSRRRLVSGKHNDERALLRPLVSRLHGLVGRIPARTIVLSDHVGRFVAEHGRVPIEGQERVYYGIDPSPFSEAAADSASRARLRAEFGFGADDLVLLCVARFAPQKAHEVLIAALAQARQEAPVRLLLVGGDPFGDGVERARVVARDLGVEQDGTCVFAGIRRDVPALMGASDGFAMASRWEGLGLVFLEAMAAGLPVLSTTVSAIPEVVEDGVTGQLVPPDDVAALAGAMVAWAGDPDRRRALGEAGARRVRTHFGLDRMVDETLAIYAELLA
ncbi:MAG: glycosyltransferase [Planctomycetota bacterium]|nr:glycosyltransferase [Planctomycetota bacterium]